MRRLKPAMKVLFEKHQWNNPQLLEALKLRPFSALIWVLIALGVVVLLLMVTGFERASEIVSGGIVLLAGILLGFFIALYVIDTRILTKGGQKK